jgi:hypothetical protein
MPRRSRRSIADRPAAQGLIDRSAFSPPSFSDCFLTESNTAHANFAHRATWFRAPSFRTFITWELQQ